MSCRGIVLFLGFVVVACGGGKKEKASSIDKYTKEPSVEATSPKEGGVGTANGGGTSALALGDIDPAMAEKGKEVFRVNCTACHKIDKRFVGPAIRGITERRSPEWIMNMILDPERMIKEDSIAKKLFEEYLSPMANQNLTKEEARQILEYFRTEL